MVVSPTATTSSTMNNKPESTSTPVVKVSSASATDAIQSQANSKNGSPVSPSIDSILKSYSLEGNNDVDLLKALLNAKAKEDERLAALDLLRTEQLRAANTLAMHQAWWMQAQMQQQFQQRQSAAIRSSPNSPPPTSTSSDLPPWSAQLGGGRWSPVPPYSSLPPTPSSHQHHIALAPISRDGSSSPPVLGADQAQTLSVSHKRPRAASTVSNSSSRSSISTTATSVDGATSPRQDPLSCEYETPSSTKKAKVASTGAKSASAKRASREEVMSALRAKCERNMTTKSIKPRALAPKPHSSTPTAPIVSAAPISPKTLSFPRAISPATTTAGQSRRDVKSASPPLRSSPVFSPADERIAAGSLRMLIHATELA